MASARRSMNAPGRSRPLLTFTTSPDVKDALKARAAAGGIPMSHLVEDLLRVALGLPPIATPASAAA